MKLSKDVYDKKKELRDLWNQCSVLSYSTENKKKISELNKLFDDYDYDRVLGVLSNVWSYEEAVSFFKDTIKAISGKKHTHIKTIATFYYRGYLGGLERVNAELLNIWNKMGLKIVFFTEEPENDLDYPYPECVKRIVLPKYDIFERLRLLKKYCIEEEIDLFINHAWLNKDALWDCVLLKLLGVYYVQYCHGHFSFYFVEGKEALIINDSYALCDLMIAISKTNALFYQMCKYNVYLVQNPVPQDLPRIPLAMNVNSRRILMAGRISSEKYPLEALDIFAKACNVLDDVVLDIVGDGDPELLKEMKDYVIENGIENKVVFHGAKIGKELEEFYRHAACILFTSKMEGYPMMMLEAKAYGLPIVMYELPYLTLVEDGKGVMSAPIDHKEQMANNLIKLMNDDDYRKKLSFEAGESYKYFVSHDHISDWNNIFSILCEDEYKDVNENYYSNNGLSKEYKEIIPVLFEKIRQGYLEDKIYGSIDYRLGNNILKFPRWISSMVNRIKGKIVRVIKSI